MPNGKQIPRKGYGDSTFGLWKNPYGFVSDRCHELGSDVFETRILMTPTICMTGPDAAQVFYDTQRVQRTGAAPEPIKATLFGMGGRAFSGG